jgi:hypothetical protein
VWLTLLHQLLLPLGVPHNITLGGTLSGRQGLQRIQLMAALRNAALQPWFTQQQQQQQQDAGASSPPRPAAVAGALELSCMGPGGLWVPDVIVYVNDIIFCAEDAMRLVLHDAHVACGMDFYDAPWMAAGPTPAAAAAAAAGGLGGDYAAAYGLQQGNRTGPPAAAGQGEPGHSSSSSSSDGLLPGLEAEDDFFDPVTGKVVPLTLSSSSSSAGSGVLKEARVSGGLRFYDKVRQGCVKV